MTNELVLKVRRVAELMREWRETYPEKSPKCNDFFNILKKNGIKLNFSYNPKIITGVDKDRDNGCEFMSAYGDDDYYLIDSKNENLNYKIGQVVRTNLWSFKIVSIELGFVFYEFISHMNPIYNGETSAIKVCQFESIMVNR